jgi:hypothetical protein
MRSIFTRRDVIRLCAASGGFTMMKGETPAKDAVDHLLFGCRDLDQSMAWVEQKTGVKPVIGGSHPGAGTRNALLALGNRQYLEIIAPDPAQKEFGDRAKSLQQLPAPRLITWAAATEEIDALRQKARSAGLAVTGPQDGSRRHPSGRLLTWRTLQVRNEFGGLIPFFIEWGAQVVHPSRDSPSGCRLLSFELEHPQPERVRELLRQLGIDGAVHRGGEARLKAAVSTPLGEIELT